METLLQNLLRDLVAIDSVNPSLAPGARGEAEAAHFLRDWLAKHGVEAELQEASGDETISRPNVIARLGPESGRAALLMVAHIDTVGAGHMPEPFTPRERDGRLYGRGALDIKSGVAAMCAAAARLAQQKTKLSEPLVIAAVVDEECNSIGTQALVKRVAAEAAVVMEPTDLRLCIAHKGYAWLEVTTRGRAAHGSLPEEGRDAIAHMGRVLAQLEVFDAGLAVSTPHPLLGRASVHASLISGGHELSSYPAECRLQVERRTLPGESDAQVECELRSLIASLARADRDFRSEVKLLASRQPYEIASTAPIATAAAAALRQVTGSPEICGMSFWTDTALLAEAGIPGVVFGPRGRGLHGADEYVELGSAATCAEVLHRLALATCCR
ncbi:MAG: ArgE/DapE family deacylase [Candidatus Acidiferrales bacterium]